MHELPVVMDIIREMDEQAQKSGFEKITEIDLVIGELSSVVDESVQMYFDVASQDHPCENAKLKFEHEPAMLKCKECGNEFPHERAFTCPKCGGDSALIKGSGRSFYIRSFDGDMHQKQEERKSE